MKFIKYYGDYVKYEELSINEYKKLGGDLKIGNKEYPTHFIKCVVKIPFNKGYNDEKLVHTLFPAKFALHDKKLNFWLIKKHL